MSNPIAYPGFCGPSSVDQSPWAGNELTMNLYLEPKADGPKLYPTPGVEVFAETVAVGGRASFAYKERAFAVIGSSFGETSSAGTFTALGTVATDQYPATICTNGDGGGQLFITSGNNGYIYDLDSGVFSQVRTGATRMGAHLDGYFLALDAETSTLFLSDLLDGTTWDPTQFSQRSIAPDPWVSMKTLDRYLVLFGTETSEVWYDAGSFPFPFAPHPSGLMPYGCAAPFSPVNVSGTLLWLGGTKDGNGLILQSAGFRPDIISSFAVATALDRASDVSDAIGDSYSDLGHTFYVLTLPIGGRTLTYDATPGLNLPPQARWADRGTWIPSENQYEAWRPLFHCKAFGKHLMLDRSGPNVYEMSADFGSDVDGRAIRRVRRPPPLFDMNRRLFVSRFEANLEVGLGT